MGASPGQLGAPQVPGPRRRAAVAWGASCSTSSSCSCPPGSRGHSGSSCARSCTRGSWGRWAAGVVFGQGVVLRHPGKIRIGDGVTDRRPGGPRRQGDEQPGDRHRQRRLPRALHDPVVQGRGHRPRGPHQPGLPLRGLLRLHGQSGEPRAIRGLRLPRREAGTSSSARTSRSSISPGPRPGLPWATTCGWAPGRRSSTASSSAANVVVGANGVVTSDLPDGSIAAGVPARILRNREKPSES